MKNVWFQVRYDIVNGIVHQWKKFLLLAIVYGVLITQFLAVCRLKHLIGQYTISDIVLYLFKGMSWITDDKSEVIIPTAYVLPNVLIAFAIGNYPFKDINGYGGMVLMRARKKSVWWISKCIWAVITSVVTYAILVVEVVAVALAGRLTGISATEYQGMTKLLLRIM